MTDNTDNESIAGSGALTDFERLYSEDISVDFEKELEHMVADLWGSPRNIDWTQQVTIRDEAKQLLMDMAVQFHYNNMSELSLCGVILQQEHLLEPKMIASLIAVSKIRNIGTWNKYLQKVNASSRVPPPEKEYFGSLESTRDATTLLLGMSVIGKVCWLALAEELDDLDEPLFSEILLQIRQQKEMKLIHVKSYLQDAIAKNEKNDTETAAALRRDARSFRAHARETVIYHQDALDALGKDAQALANHVERDITQFYRDVGLDV